MPPEVPYSFDPYQMMGDYENSPSSDNDLPNPDPNNPVYGVIGYAASIPFQANATIARAFGARNFAERLDEMGMNMRSERSQRAAREYDKQRNLIAAIREHPMEFPHRVAQGVVIAGETYLLGQGLRVAGPALGVAALGSSATAFATSVLGQGAVNFGNAYNELRDEGYPRGRAAFRASGDAAISTATDLTGGLMKFAARPLAKAGIEAADEAINEVGGKLYGMIPRGSWYRGQVVEPMPEGAELVPVIERNPDYVPAYAPRLGAVSRVPVRGNPEPDPDYVPGGAWWRDRDTGEAYYAERPVYRQNFQPDRRIHEEEARNYPLGY